MPKTVAPIVVKVEGFDDLSSAVKATLKPLNSLDSQIKDLTKTIKALSAATSGGSGGGIAKSLKEVLGIFKDTPVVPSQTIRAYKELFRALGDISDGLKKATDNLPNEKKAESFGTSLKNIVSSFKDIPDIRPGTLQALTGFLRGLGPVVDGIQMVVEKGGTINLKRFGLFDRKGVKNLKAFIQMFTDLAQSIPSGGSASLRPMVDLLQGLPPVLIQMGVVVRSLGKVSLKNIVGFDTKGFKNLKRIISTIVDVAQSIGRLGGGETGFAFKIDATAKLMRNITVLGTAIGSGKVDWKFVSAQTRSVKIFINEVGKALKSVGRGFGINRGKLQAASDLVKGLADLMRLITQNEDAFTGFGAEGETDFGQRLRKLFDDLDQALKGLKGFKTGSTKQLAALFKSLGTLNKVKLTEGTVKSLSTLLRAIADMSAGGVGKIDAKGIASVIKELAKAAKQIGKVDLDPAKVQALKDLAEIRDVGGVGGAIDTPLAQMNEELGDIPGNVQTAASSLRNTLGGALNIIGRTLRTVFGVSGLIRSFKGMVRDAAQTLSRSFREAGRELREIGRDMREIGRDLIIGGGIAGLIQSQGVQTAANFEAIIKQIEVLGGVTGDELELVNEFILELGQSSVFSSSQVAEAFLDLSKAGLDTQDIFAALPHIMDLAAAGSVGVADAAGLVIAAVGSFEDLGFEDTVAIVDSLVAAANVGIAEVSDLAAAFGFAAPAANAFGQELDLTNAALTLLIDRGLDASSAGTSLRRLFSALKDPTTEAADALALYQIELFDANGNFLDATDIMEQLIGVTEYMTEAQRAAFLAQIGGSENATAALEILLSTTEDGTLVWEEYIEKMDESASANEVANALMDTFNGSLEELSGAAENLLIKGLTPLIEYGLRPLVQGLTEVVTWISNLPDPILAMGAALTGIIPLLALFTGIGLYLGGIVLSQLGTALTVISGAIWALLNPIQAILVLTAGQGILVAMFSGAVFLIPLLLTFGSALQMIYESFQRVSETGLVATLANNLSLLRKSITELLGPLLTLAGAVLGSIVTPAFDSVDASITRFIESINSAVVKARSAVEPLADSLTKVVNFFGLGGITEAVSTAVDDFPILDAAYRAQQAIEDVKNALDFDPLETFHLIDPEMLGDFDFAVATFEEGREFLLNNSVEWDLDIAAWRELIEGVERVRDILSAPVGAGYLDWIPDGELEALSGIAGVAGESFETLNEMFGELAENPFFQWLFGPDVTGVDLTAIFIQFVILGEKVHTMFEGLADSIADFFNSLADGVPVGEAVGALLNDLVSTALQLTGVGMEGLEIAFGLDFDGAAQVLQEGSLRGFFEEYGAQIVDWLAAGAVRNLGRIASVFTGIFDAVFGTNLTEPVGLIFGRLEDAVLGFLALSRLLIERFSGPAGRLLEEYFNGLASQLDTVAYVLNEVAYQLGLFFLMLDRVGSQQTFINLATILFGPRGLDAATFIIDQIYELADSITFALSQIGGLLSGGITFTDFARTLATGILADLISLGKDVWDVVIEPLGSGLLNALGRFFTETNWADVWENFKTGLLAALSATGALIKLAWSNLVTFLNDIDWGVIWAEATAGFVDQVSSGIKKVKIAWNSIIEFVGLTELQTQITDGITAIAEGVDSTILGDLTDTFNALGEVKLEPRTLLALGAAFTAIGGALALFDVPVFAAVGKAITALVGGLTFSGVATVAAIAITLYGLANALPDLIAAGEDLLDGNISGALKEFGDALSSFVDSIAGLFELFGDAAADALGVTDEWEQVKSALTEFGLALEPVFIGLGDAGAGAIQNLVDFVESLVGLFVVIGEKLGESDAFVDVLTVVGIAIAGILGAAAGITAAAITGLVAFISGLANALAMLFDILSGEEDVEGVGDAFKKIFQAFGEGFADVWQPVIEGFEGFLNQLNYSFELLWLDVALGFLEIVGATVGAVLGSFDLILDAAGLAINLDKPIDDAKAALAVRREGVALGVELGNQVREGLDDSDLATDLVNSLFAPEAVGGATDAEAAVIRENLAGLISTIFSGLDLTDTEATSLFNERLFFLLEDGALSPEQIDSLATVLGEDYMRALVMGVEHGDFGDINEALLNTFLGVTEEIDADAMIAADDIIDPDTATDVETELEVMRSGYQTMTDETAANVIDMQTNMTDYGTTIETVVDAAGIDMLALATSAGETATAIMAATGRMTLDMETFKANALVDLQQTMTKMGRMKATIIDMSTVGRTQVDLLRAQIALLAAEWSALDGLNVTMSIMGTGVEPPPPGRAEGGPVFKDQLYEVAENGLSELLRIGGRTFLIPGQDGNVIPPTRTQGTQHSNVGLNDNAQAQRVDPYAQGGYGPPRTIGGPQQQQALMVTYGDTFVTVEGSDLSPDELEQTITRSIRDVDEERSRDWESEMRASGRV